MARISGVNVPENKRAVIALTYIFGIGKSNSQKILQKLKIDENKKIKDMSEHELTLIRQEVTKYPINGDLRRTVALNIKRMMEIGSYRGLRHRKHLPVRGQSTKQNARTRKGRKASKALVRRR